MPPNLAQRVFLRHIGKLSNSLTNSVIRNCSSSYLVRKVKYLEKLKINDSALVAEFKSSKFVVFLDKMPLCWNNQKSDHYHLAVFPYQELWRVCTQYDLNLSHHTSALVDVVPRQSATDDIECAFDPLMATNLRLGDIPAAQSFAKSLKAKLVDFRMAFLQVSSGKDAQWLTKANTLLRWAHTSNYCPKCATKVWLKVSKASAECPQCKLHFHPRVSPVAICLIVDPTNQHCLLVRQPSHRPGFFTAVAGFSEPGETIEETAAREITEEVGIVVDSLKYTHLSQSWPFPQNSLMCAFLATASMETQLNMDYDELEDARWFSRAQIQAAFSNSIKPIKELLQITKEGVARGEKFISTPPPGTLAYHMIKQWLNQ